MNHKSLFFKYVIPSIIAFALSGIYAIVDGYFVGNTIGDAGISAINIAYPIEALIQALGTGIGMGGAVYYSINAAEKKGKRAEEFIATSWWLLVIVSVINTIIIYSFSSKILGLLGADGIILTNATDYIKIIALGAILQILGTGMMPFIRNYGNSFWSMFAMVGGFITNIVLDFIFVWIYEMGMKGAATATIAGQGVTAAIAIIYALYNKKFYVYVSLKNVKEMCGAIFRVGLAPFGLALTPNISLVFINRFSASYGGEKAIATYACVSYIICIIYLILQGVGDGSQPLMSRFYGEKDQESISPNSITEFAVSGDAGQYITPEIIFGNNDLVIFEQEDGSGWELNEGETLMIQATEYEAETNGGNGQGIMYFYICDGEILDRKSEPRKELNQTFELTA